MLLSPHGATNCCGDKNPVEKKPTATEVTAMKQTEFSEQPLIAFYQLIKH